MSGPMPPPEDGIRPTGGRGAEPDDHQGSGITVEGSAVDRPMTRDEARALTDSAKADWDQFWKKLAELYDREAWKPLGYESFVTYCRAEFDTSRIRIPILERSAIVSRMAEVGMNQREIAAATGLSQSTVSRSSDSSESDDLDVPNEPDPAPRRRRPAATGVKPQEPSSSARRCNPGVEHEFFVYMEQAAKYAKTFCNILNAARRALALPVDIDRIHFGNQPCETWDRNELVGAFKRDHIVRTGELLNEILYQLADAGMKFEVITEEGDPE